MNPKDIRTSTDPDLAGSFAAIQRAARSAQDLAIRTNTSILVSVDGKDVEEGDPHQRHEVVERVNEVPLVSRTYTKDDEEVTLTLTLT